jgi:hypothetical protein
MFCGFLFFFFSFPSVELQNKNNKEQLLTLCIWCFYGREKGSPLPLGCPAWLASLPESCIQEIRAELLQARSSANFSYHSGFAVVL